MDINNEVNKNKIISEDDLFMSEDDSENEWSSQHFIQAVNAAEFEAAEADDDDSEEDDWDNDINELNEVEAEKVKKDKEENSTEKPIASTSTGQKNGYGIPTKPKSKLKNPKPSNKEFKGIAYCW